MSNDHRSSKNIKLKLQYGLINKIAMMTAQEYSSQTEVLLLFTVETQQ